MIHRAQIATIPEYVHWHNTIKPHLSLNIEALETPIQAFHRKLPQDRKEITQTIKKRNNIGIPQHQTIVS
jgi:hypothetical protein